MVILLYPEYKVNIFSVDKPIKESNNYYAPFYRGGGGVFRRLRDTIVY